MLERTTNNNKETKRGKSLQEIHQKSEKVIRVKIKSRGRRKREERAIVGYFDMPLGRGAKKEPCRSTVIPRELPKSFVEPQRAS